MSCVSAVLSGYFVVEDNKIIITSRSIILNMLKYVINVADETENSI